MRSWERNRLRRSYLDEWVRPIDEQGGSGIWQWAVSKDLADIAGILENVAGRGKD